MSDKKYYEVTTFTHSLWKDLHNELVTDGIGNVSRCVECSDSKKHSKTRSTYLLTDTEASELRQDPRVKNIQTDPKYYPDDYRIPEDDLKMEVPVPRYTAPIKNYHTWADPFPREDFDIGETGLNRVTSQLLRLQQRNNPWLNQGDQAVIEQIPKQRFTGKDVDVICADNGTWIGHVEFINSNVVNAVNPENYIGGNPLPGNGFCDVLDVILDGPYYLDPDYFNSDPNNRLITRWDGTIVPTEQAARDWWANENNRSPGFDFGSITINSTYTRDGQHGSNTTYPTEATANHGTQCASLIYGRTHGWAYNANKWHLNLYGTGSNPISTGFDVQKIFHQYKPINPDYGNKNPTISSNSWGFRANKNGSFYYWREDAPVSYGGTSDEPEFIRYMGIDGDGGRWSSEHGTHSETIAGDELIDAGVIFVASAGNSGQQQVSPNHPNFNNFISNSDNADVDDFSYSEFGRPTKGTTNRRGFPNHIGQTSAYEYPAIAVGALDDVFSSDGRERKVDYSNMGNSVDIYAPADGILAATVGSYGTDVTRYDNTYPTLAIGTTRQVNLNFTGTPNVGDTISVSSLDGYSLSFTFTPDNFIITNTNDVDISFSGEMTTTGTFNGDNLSVEADIFFNFLDAGASNTYVYDESFNASFLPPPPIEPLQEISLVDIDFNINVPTENTESRDTRFGGTSAACPIACGLISTWVEQNRTWTYRDVRKYIEQRLQTQDSSNFYIGIEAQDPNGPEWQDRNNIQSSSATVIYEGLVVPRPFTSKTGSFNLNGNLTVRYK